MRSLTVSVVAVITSVCCFGVGPFCCGNRDLRELAPLASLPSLSVSDQLPCCIFIHLSARPCPRLVLCVSESHAFAFL